jgi:hypothetical protein
MSDRLPIIAAEAEVERSRARLVDTVQLLARQLEPRRLVRELWEDAKVKGADLAEDAVDAVKARPLASTGIVAALAMFLAREPLMDMAGKVTSSIGEKRKAKKASKAQKRSKATDKSRRKGAANDDVSKTESA